jgi:hypothetical protein
MASMSATKAAGRVPADAGRPVSTRGRSVSTRSGVSDEMRIQILAAEHWSLLATRNLTWNEIFSRATMYITVLSATVVALALIAQASGFGTEFRVFALILLSIVLLVGFATFVRLGEANSDDIGLVLAMNRVRHGYLDLAPELQPYFTTSQYDDLAGILQSYGTGFRLAVGRFIGGTPSLVATINVVVAGAIGGLAAEALGAMGIVPILVGIGVAVVTALAEIIMVLRAVRAGRREHVPRFPQPAESTDADA